MLAIETLLKAPTWQQSYAVYALTGTDYPLLFTKFLRQALARQQLTFTYVELAQLEPAALKALLALRVLGQTNYYWLGDLAVLPAKRQTELVQYLAQYQGPHRIGLFLTTAQAQPLAQCANVWLTDLTPYEAQPAKQLANLGQHYFQLQQQSVPQKFLSHLSKLNQALSLDQYLLLLHYGLLFGERATPFFTQWLPKIVTLEQSLFTLSGHFFAGQATAFFNTLEPLTAEYSEQFWTAYWSEQLFRAYYYSLLQQQGDQAGAKRIGQRLPYSFMQQDWRRFTLLELQQAHSFIQRADYELKSGASVILLELFYLQFLNGDFKSAGFY